MHQSSNEAVVVTVAPASKCTRECCTRKQTLVLGVVQLILGVLCFVCQTAAIATGEFLTLQGAGIWGGILIMAVGGVAIGAARRRSNCLIVTVMAMSIIISIILLIVIIRGSRDYVNHDGVYVSELCPSTRETLCEVAMNIVAGVCAIAEVVVAVWAFALCCAVSCCRSRRQTRESGPVYHGPTSQMCQITDTSMPVPMLSTVIGNGNYPPTGEMFVISHPVPMENTLLPSYAEATAAQQDSPPNYAEATAHEQPLPQYTLKTAEPTA